MFNNNNYNAKEIMEAVKAAEQAMLQAEQNRLMAIEYHMTELKELGADMNHTTTNVNININKGRIIEITKEVEVPVTKEVVIDNTDNDRIQKLEEESAFKELLLNEYRDNMDEKIKTIHELEDKIEDLEIELESKDMFIEGMKIGHKNEIAELKAEYEAKIKRLETKIMLLESEDEVFEEEEEIVADNDGGDAVSLFNIPEEYKDNQEIKSIVEKNTEKYNNAQGFGAGPFQVTAEQEKEEIIKQTNKAIQKCIDEIKKTDDYKISLTKLYDKKNQVVTAVKGHITLAGRQYAFKYGATHENPCVYGCMDMNLITEAKKVLDSVSGMIKDTTEQKHAYDVVYAFDKGYVVWQAEDGCYKGYTKDYAFSWDGKQAQPCGATLMNAIENKPFRPMNKSWGNGFVKRANEIMAFCKTIDKYFKSTNEEPEETNEIIVNTNDVVLNVAQEVEELDI